MTDVPITFGEGQASIATQTIAGKDYQVIKLVGGETGSTSVLGVNPDRSINVSVIGAINVTGSVFQTGTSSTSIITGNASLITVFQSSSLIAVAAGSVVTVSQGSVITVLQAPSIAGTYAEDAAHTTGDRGLYALAVRRDDMASITSADGEYSGFIVGPSGEQVVANSPITRWVQGTADLRVVQGASVAVLAAQGTSVFTYITGAQVANFGSSSVLVTFAGGLGSILGYTIAPAGGGSNIVYPNALKTGANSAFTASINGTASVLVSAQGFIARI